MPDSIGDPFAPPLLYTRSSIDTPVLPVHVAQYREKIERNRQKSISEQGFELSQLDTTEGEPGVVTESSKPTRSQEYFSESESEASEQDHLVPESSQETQMRRTKQQGKKSRSTSRPNLRISTGRDTETNGHLTNGHTNGHVTANGDMDSHLRRKHAQQSTDSEMMKENLMRRHDFSLDNEPPAPQTPQTPGMVNTSFSDLPPNDKRNFLLLVLLYFLQGIPMGLASGSVPFLLKPYLSYGQIGVFSLAIYPYSLKLLWSPIVDAVWSRRFGRRKSWITPIQTISGMSMIYLGGHIDEMMKTAGANGGEGVWNFTGWWFLLVFLCATQDIAVDGWAISLLSIQNISYASTAQTVGLTAGSFLSHTVFLALQAPEFANRWFRSTPLDVGVWTLGGYMVFWGWAYLIVTVGLAVLKKEEKNKDQDGILEVYQSMWSVLKLKNILGIIAIHLIAKLGFITNESVTNLKLIDKGFGSANLALVVLIDFPFEISLGYYAGKWSTEYTPLKLWCWAFVARLVAAIFAQFTIMVYPTAPDEAVPAWYILIVILSHVYTTFMGTIMFVAVSAFHARIADPAIGGTYMTLLATVSNLGGTFPKFFILKFVDLFTSATCLPPSASEFLAFRTDHKDAVAITESFSCALEEARQRCIAGGGTCHVERDGYYITNVLFVIVGALLFWGFIERKALALQALPLRAWRVVNGENGYARVAN